MSRIESYGNKLKCDGSKCSLKRASQRIRRQPFREAIDDLRQG
jgi:hypothetical protein